MFFTLTVFGSLIGVVRELWSLPFWRIIAASLVLHAILVLHLRTLINQVPMILIFFCAAAEVVVIASAMGWTLNRQAEYGTAIGSACWE